MYTNILNLKHFFFFFFFFIQGWIPSEKKNFVHFSFSLIFSSISLSSRGWEILMWRLKFPRCKILLQKRQLIWLFLMLCLTFLWSSRAFLGTIMSHLVHFTLAKGSRFPGFSFWISSSSLSERFSSIPITLSSASCSEEMLAIIMFVSFTIALSFCKLYHLLIMFLVYVS